MDIEITTGSIEDIMHDWMSKPISDRNRVRKHVLTVVAYNQLNDTEKDIVAERVTKRLTGMVETFIKDSIIDIAINVGAYEAFFSERTKIN